MQKKHYLYQNDSIKVEFDVEAVPHGQIAIVVREGAANKRYRVHNLELHSSVAFPYNLTGPARLKYMPTLVHLPIIMDRLYRLCAEEDLEFIEFVFELTQEKLEIINAYSS